MAVKDLSENQREVIARIAQKTYSVLAREIEATTGKNTNLSNSALFLEVLLNMSNSGIKTLVDSGVISRGEATLIVNNTFGQYLKVIEGGRA